MVNLIKKFQSAVTAQTETQNCLFEFSVYIFPISLPCLSQALRIRFSVQEILNMP